MFQTITKKITKEEYQESKNSPQNYREKVYDNLPQSWVAGYGYYGFRTYEKDDKYYIDHTIGSSCD